MIVRSLSNSCLYDGECSSRVIVGDVAVAVILTVCLAAVDANDRCGAKDVAEARQ